MLKKKNKKEKFIAKYAKRNGLNTLFTSGKNSAHAVAGVDCAHG